MNTQWELYFLRREIERQKIQKQRKKKRRIWIAGISGLLALVFLAGGISMVRSAQRNSMISDWRQSGCHSM